MKILEQYHPSIPYEKEQAQLISVIVAAYNIEAYVERGVRSICAQTYQNLEIILVDDGSADETGHICDKLAAEDKRIRVIHKPNGGLSDARNAGMAQSTGAYIGFMDGDDWIDPDMYERMFSALLGQQADAAVCRYRQVYKDHTEDGSVDRAVLFEGQEALQCYVEEREEYAIQNAAWNKLYRREILDGLSFPVGKWYEDILFTTSALARAKRCIYLDTAHYNYIIDREGSIMNAQINSRTFTDLIPAYYEKTKFLQELGREDLARVHDYFFYKRLLLFYTQVSHQPYLTELENILRKDEERVRTAFGDPIVDPRERRKLSLFYKSPAHYCRRIRWEERVVIPLKARVKAIWRTIPGSIGK